MTLEQEFGSDLVYGAKLHEEMLLLLDTLDGMKGTDVLPSASDYMELAHRVLLEKHYTPAQCEEMLAHVEPYKLRAFVQVHASAELICTIDVNVTDILMARTPETDYETRIRLVNEMNARIDAIADRTQRRQTNV